MYIVEFDSLTEKLKMIDITFLPVISIQTLAFLKLGSPMGMGMVPELHPDVRGVWKKCQMTNCTMPNNLSSMKYALKSVPGLADVGVLELQPQGLDNFLND